MEYLTLSLNITLPFVLVAALGVFLKARGMIGDEFVRQGNKVIFYAAIPTTIFNHIHRANLAEVFDLPFLLFNIGSLIAFFLGTWVVARRVMKDKDSVPSFVNSAYRSSLSVLAPPLLVLMLSGNADTNLLPKAILTVSVMLITSYATASVLFAVHDPAARAKGAGGVLLAIAKNPVVIGVVVGLVVNLLGITLPTFAANTVDRFGALVMPLAMLCVGANLKFLGFDAKFKYVTWAVVVKLFVMPLVVVAIAFAMGFRGGDLTIIMIMNALPMAVGAYVQQAEQGGDTYIGASVLMVTMTLSSLTLTLYIFLFKLLGIFVGY
ncbi:MAG: AEC family transporter [Cellulomonadaceae bacterium]|nr:AEC family transporter [Cellulomonadaceae bacterium]